jgi:hypothetical protein
MVEDIKIVQRYDWRAKDNGQRVWDAVSYMIMVKRDGQWSEVEVQHINPFPPEEKDHEDGERSS